MSKTKKRARNVADDESELVNEYAENKAAGVGNNKLGPEKLRLNKNGFSLFVGKYVRRWR